MSNTELIPFPVFDLSPNTETNEQPIPLTLKGLHEALKERNVSIGYSSLSELITEGDIAHQLGAGGGANRREFHRDVAPVFAEFIRSFRRAGGKTPQAPAMLRSFLKQQIGSGGGELVPVSEEGSAIAEMPKQAQPATLEAYAAQGRAQGLAMTERVLTAHECAAVLQLSVSLFRQTVKPWKRFGNSPRGDRWLLSQILSLE
jgi:hypothetical protein